MDNALQIFKNQDFGKIRGLMIDGEVWFVGKDVAKALGYKNPPKAVRDHVDEEDKTVNESFTVNGTTPILINESGLYSLILSSKLPKTKEFKRWVTAEVLPSIRQTGMYVTDKAYLKWLETRQHGTITRKFETSVIKNYITYARSQGCTWNDGFIYGIITTWCNLGAGIAQKNGRDNANIQQLNTIDLLEGKVIPSILIDGVAKGLHYTQIWAQVQKQINLFLKVTFQTPKLLKYP